MALIVHFPHCPPAVQVTKFPYSEDQNTGFNFRFSILYFVRPRRRTTAREILRITFLSFKNSTSFIIMEVAHDAGCNAMKPGQSGLR